jgi:hypothetical protein
MKTLALAALAAATVAVAAPASAQIAVDTPVGGVRIGPTYRDHHDYRVYRAERDAYASCRTIKTRTVTPSGRVIIERKQVCR